MLQYLSGVSSLKLDKRICTNCLSCVDVCPSGVLIKGPERKLMIKNIDACIECGACQMNCSTGAITVNAGVGCAAAYINSIFNGGKVCCDPKGGGKNCC